MTDYFAYNKDEFELNIISCFKNFPTSDMREFIDIEMGPNCGQTFKNSVFRRIISYKVGKNWWFKVDDSCRRSVVTRELVAIWKLVISHKRIAYEFDGQTIEAYCQDRLADVEKDLADGKFNEQTYIDKCNWIKHLKETDEELLDCCDCCPIGSFNSQVLNIICMPCEWDIKSSCVKFT